MSEAKKKRRHLLRNKGRDVETGRGWAVDFSMHERKTKTKREKIEKRYKKHKRPSSTHRLDGEDGLFSCAE